MHAYSQPFWMPKSGNSESEYEDAFFPNKPPSSEAPCIRFAVADGATETSYSGIWAKQLVRKYCKTSYGDVLDPSTLASLQTRWLTIVRKRHLPWYAEEKVRDGAFATILGLTVRDNAGRTGADGEWSAFAIGDSCLVQIRNEDVLTRFPLDKSASFNNRPVLLSSNPTHNSSSAAHAKHISGDWLRGDSFYLMTDALACWFMASLEEGQHPWKILRDLETRDQAQAFPDWIADLRADRRLKNDDVTLLRIDLT